ncbi:MAG: GLUG motif-containing protein, partial [Eubacteriales bacterium]|nr:GLUG motif-containing protein [Eubacteriales bacterium]
MSRKRILSLSEQTGRGGQRRGRKAGRRRRNGASLGARACAAAVSVCLAAGMIQAALPLPVQAAQGALQAAVEETAAAVNENASGENSAGEDGSGQDTDSAKQREHASEIRPIVTQRPEKTVAVSIRTVSDLRELARNCSLDSYSLDKIVTLEEDLDLAGEEITIPSFSGTFDGQNHTISGVNLQGSTSGAGLFTYVEEGGVVENLRVEGTVTPDGEQAYAGGIAGTNRGLIRSCSFSGDVSAVSYVGGIAGSNGETGEIAGCTAEGTVQGTRYTGGIAGQNLGVIRRSVNEASVNTTVQDQSPSTEALESLLYRTLKADDSQAEVVASTDIGGIAGYSGGILQSCTNNGAVGYQHVGYNVGGIVGRQSGYLNGCVNNGAVYGRKDVGGIAGQMVPDIELLFSESSLADLQAELDTLNELLDTAAADAGESSAAVSERLGQTAEYLDGAQESAKEISDLLHGSIESNVATINSLAAAIDRHIDSLTPILSDFHTASSGATSLFDNMSDISGSLHESFRLTGDSISRLRSLVQNLKSACDNIRSSLDALKEALRLAGQNVPASVEQLEKDLAVLASQLNSLSQNIDKAQEEIKSGTVNTETARAIFNDLTGVLKQAGVVMKDLEQVLSDVNWSAAAGSDVSMPESGTSGAEKNETAGTDKTETSGADSSSDTGKTETSDNETSDTGKTETSGSGTSGEESTDTAGSGTTGSGNDAGASGGESTSGSETGSEESDGGKSEVSGMENSGADKSTEEEASGNGSEGNSSVNGGETSGTAASDSGDGGAAQREESSPVSHEDGSPESVAAKSTPVALLPEHSVTVASAAGYIPALLGSRDKENDRADSSENGNSGAGNSSASSSANGNSSANGGTDGGSAGDNSSTGGDSVNDNSSTDDTGDSGNDGTSPDSQDGSQNTDNTDDSGDSQNSSGGNSANGNSSTGTSSAGNSANGTRRTGNSSAGSSATGTSTGGDSPDR